MSNTNAKLEYESGVTIFANAALTDSGDHKKYTSAASLWSEATGCAPTVHPDGIVTGCVLTPAASGTNNLVDMTAGTAYIKGVLTTISAQTDLVAVRGASGKAKICSIVIDDDATVDVVQGTDSADATVNETRNTAGGPPYVPVDNIEVGQVRFLSSTAAAVTAADLFQTIGTHREMTWYPSYTADNADGSITFSSANPLSHTGGVTRKTWAEVCEPVFTEQAFANDFVPPETTHSTSSTQVYGATVGSSSSSLNQGSFTAILHDGITDNILLKKNENLWFRFYQDRYQAAHILAQGYLGVSRTFGAADNPKVSCTISPLAAAVDKSG